MKLSTAILLGDVLKKANPSHFICAGEGCALGGAVMAVGREADYVTLPNVTVANIWPWFTPEHFEEVSGQYHKVCEGKLTIEDVAAYVRTIEPAEEDTPQTESEALLVAASVAQ